MVAINIIWVIFPGVEFNRYNSGLWGSICGSVNNPQPLAVAVGGSGMIGGENESQPLAANRESLWADVEFECSVERSDFVSVSDQKRVFVNGPAGFIGDRSSSDIRRDLNSVKKNSSVVVKNELRLVLVGEKWEVELEAPCGDDGAAEEGGDGGQEEESDGC